MRILIIHNQLWAHYKSKLFYEINNCIKENYPESEFLVVHIALYEASRSGMQDEEKYQYSYPYKVLFNGSLSEVGFKERLFALIHAFNEFKPTILNVTGYFDWAQIILMAYAKSKGVKIVLSSESSSADSNRTKMKEIIKSRIVSLADSFFCFGKTSANYLLSLGVKPSQIAVDHAAVIDEDIIRKNYDQAKLENVQLASQTLPKRNFIFAGRLAPEKNLEMLIKAFIQLQNSIPETKSWGLLFVGEGPLRSSLEKLANDNPIPGNINFAGGWPWHKVPQWLAKSDVLVLPSISEPWGLVVNEAMVCGMPVIVSKNCGCAEDLLKENVNGFIFDPLNSEELKRALLYFIQNPEKMNSMGIESQSIITQFSSKNVAAQMVNCYKNLSA